MRNILFVVITLFFCLGVNANDCCDLPKQDTPPKDLIDGVDNMLYKKDKNAVPYDWAPITPTQNCSLDARFDIRMKGMTVEFINKSKGRFTDVEWTFGDGILSQDVMKTQHTYKEEGLFFFSVTIYNSLTSCIDVYSGQIYVFDTSNLASNEPDNK